MIRKTEDEGRLLIVLGGSFCGAFAAGTLHAMHEMGVQAQSFSRIVGVSVGAHCAAYYATGIGNGLRIWTEDYLNRLYSPWHLFRLQRPLDLQYLMRIFRELEPLSLQKLRTCPMPVEVVMTDCATGNGYFVDIRNNPDIFTALTATAALPFVHAPVPMHGIDYIDGGLANAAQAFRERIERASEVTLILSWTKEECCWDSVPRWLPFAAFPFNRAGRDVVRRAPERFNAIMRVLFASEWQHKMRIIAPAQPLVPNVLRHPFDTRNDAVMTVIELGEQAARRAFRARPTWA